MVIQKDAAKANVEFTLGTQIDNLKNSVIELSNSITKLNNVIKGKDSKIIELLNASKVNLS